MTPLAVLDIGSNSAKLLVARREGSAMRLLRDDMRITRLGEGLQPGGLLKPAAIQRALAAAIELHALASASGAEVIATVGTMALRQAANSHDFAARLRVRTGLELRVISGEEEARLSFVGAVHGLVQPGERVLVFDTGGGSTECICGTATGPEHSVSLPLGAGNLTESFLPADPPSEQALARLMDHLRAALRDGLPPCAAERVIGVGGTVTTVAALEQQLEPYDGTLVHGQQLATQTVSRWLHRLAVMPLAQREHLPGLHPGRAPVIVGGVAVAAALLLHTGLPGLVVSDHGLRHGLWWELVAERA